MLKVIVYTISLLLATMFLTALCATSLAWAADETPLTLFTFNRPPYYVIHGGRPAGGFLLDTAMAVLDRAGIPYTVQEMPPGRVVATFQSEVVNACAVGWLKTPERETFSLFSSPIYQSESLAAAVKSNTPLFHDGPTTLAALLQAGLTWGVREGFSYGAAADKAFAALPEKKIHRFSDPHHMLRLLAKGRLDVVLIEPGELTWLLRQEPALSPSIRLLPLADVPSGVSRHIMCDASVGPALMARINAAIKEYLGTGDYRLQTAFAARH